VDPRYVTWEQLGTMFEAFSEPQTSTIYSTSISVTQPIFTFGKIGTAIKVAKTYNESARLSFGRNLQTLQLAAIDAFYLVSLGDKSADIAQRALERKTQLHEFIDRNFQLGSGLKAQVLATKADVMQQVSRVIDAKKNAAKGRMFLSYTTGRSIADSVSLDSSIIPVALQNGDLPEQSEAVRSALESRKDISSLRMLAESTRGGAKIFRAMYYPSIAAFGSAGWSKFESGAQLFANNGMGNWMVGIGASWTLFDGFSYSAKAAQYASDAEKLEIAASMLRKGIEIEIRDAILESKAADSNLIASQQMFSAAREAYDLTYDNFKQGSGQLADLQRVDDQLQLAELGLINARYRQIRSRAALLVAMGQNIITIDSEEQK
jgi:outer membrane protein